MKQLTAAVIVASGAFAGYLLYRYFKNSSSKKRELLKKSAKVPLEDIIAILTSLKEGVCVAFGSFYPRSLLCTLKPEETEGNVETVCEAFEGLCQQSQVNYSDFEESLECFKDDDEEIKSYYRGVEIMTKLIKDPINPTKYLNEELKESYITELSREMLSKWKEECESMIDEICIESQLTHFQLTQMFLSNDISNSTYRDIIVRMHNRYKRIMKEISIENKQNELELYATFTCYITSHSQLFLIPQECGDIAAARLTRLLKPFESSKKLTVEETMNNIKSKFENILKENKDLILEKINDENSNKTMKDLFKDSKIRGSSLNLIITQEDKETEDVKNLKDTMYNLKIYIEENTIQQLLNEFSIELEIPYKFIIDYLSCMCQLTVLSESQKSALFIDGYIIDTQSIVTCAIHLSEEEDKSAFHELIKNYIEIMKDEDSELYKKIKNERNVKIQSLLQIFALSEDFFDVLNIVLMNDEKRFRWCFKVIKDNNEFGSRKITDAFNQ